MLQPTLAVMPGVAALVTAACWGAGDFCGGFAARRTSPLAIIAIAHGLDILLFGAWLLFTHQHAPSPQALLWGTASGLVNGFALACFYSALASGAMGVAAAWCGLLTAVVPVVAGALAQGRPHGIVLAGFALAAAAIVLLSRSDNDEQRHTSRRALLLATFAGVGFGAFLVMSRAAAQTQFVWPSLLSRAGSTFIAIAGLLAAPHLFPALRWQRPHSGALTLALSAGVLDAAGNLLYMWAATHGRMDVAAVLASLYPAGTIVLAILFLNERLARAQALGVGAALAAAAMISLG